MGTDLSPIEIKNNELYYFCSELIYHFKNDMNVEEKIYIANSLFWLLRIRYTNVMNYGHIEVYYIIESFLGTWLADIQQSSHIYLHVT